MTRKATANMYLFLVPFAICIGLEFLPWWLSYPLCFIGVLKWLNEMIIVGEKDKNNA